MATVTVYRFEKFDILSDENKVGPRMATQNKIREIGAQVVEGSGREVDAALVSDGFFDPSGSRSTG